MSDPSLVEVTINVPELEAAVAAWRTGIGLEAVVDASARRARIDVKGVAIVLVEAYGELSGTLSGVVLGVEDLASMRTALIDITTTPGAELTLDRGATSGAPITLVETPLR